MKLKPEFIKGIFLAVFCLFFAANASGQNQCLTKAESDMVVKTVAEPKSSKPNKKIRKRLERMAQERRNIERELGFQKKSLNKKLARRNELSRKQTLELCQIFKTHGWLSIKNIRKDGLYSVLFLIRNTIDPKLQRELLPVFVEAAQKGQVKKDVIASLIDSIRIKSGLPQIFGTQVVLKDEVAYLKPLLNEKKVDEWRKAYDLNPLNNFMRNIEERYQTIVLKQRLSVPIKVQKIKIGKNKNGAEILGLNDDEDELLTVETRLVNLNARVLNKDQTPYRQTALTKEDFAIFENEKEQPISFFSTTGTPFDLILLLDLSGSTLEKRSVIWNAVERFIEVIRPDDRIAIVSPGYGELQILGEFSENRANLFKKVKKENYMGSSKIWDALDQTYEKVIVPKSKGRRTAIIFMTDGLELNSSLAFGNLLEQVRDRDATIFSIHLSSRRSDSRNPYSRMFRTATRTLKILADETGGIYHRAKKIKDLRGIYEQIAEELSQVYSLAYEPAYEERDGTWQRIQIKIKDRPNLIVRSKKGYYAK